jgi:HD-GYP domain-containing protein (c-di-GMP phosphodiesterase class II)
MVAINSQPSGPSRQVIASPQQIYVAAPKATAWIMLRNTEYSPPADSGRSITIQSNEGAQTLIEFTNRATRAPDRMVKSMTVVGPNRLMYRHVSGLYTGAVEELTVRDTSLGSEIEISGSFAARDGMASGLIKLTFERMLYEHLHDIKLAAEQRAASTGELAHSGMLLAQVPSLQSEEALLKAVETQEEAEWGHSGHGQGVARVALSVAAGLGLDSAVLDHLHRAALLHDVGKIAIDAAIWGERGPIRPAARAQMAAHPLLGRDLAARAGLSDPVLEGILHHHERWDGQGYPSGLIATSIPLPVRILALAESIDSMLRASYRRSPLRPPEVLARLESGAGRQWDPDLARKARSIIRGH